MYGLKKSLKEALSVFPDGVALKVEKLAGEVTGVPLPFSNWNDNELNSEVWPLSERLVIGIKKLLVVKLYSCEKEPAPNTGVVAYIAKAAEEVISRILSNK